MPLAGILRGWDGKVTYGTADVTIAAIKSFEITIDQAINEEGDFLADAGVTYAVRGSVSAKFSYKGIIPSGGEVSQTAIRAAMAAGTDIKHTFVSTGSGSVVITNATIEQIKIGHDGKNGTSFEASGRNNGSFTY